MAFPPAQSKAEGLFQPKSCQSDTCVVVNYHQKCEAHNHINCLLAPLTKVAVPTARTAEQLMKSSFMKLRKVYIIRPDLNICISEATVQPVWLSWLYCNPCQRWHTLQSSAFNLLLPRVRTSHKFRHNWVTMVRRNSVVHADKPHMYTAFLGILSCHWQWRKEAAG